jgi:hypothetical protein
MRVFPDEKHASREPKEEEASTEKKKFLTRENIASYEPRARGKRKNEKLLVDEEGKVCE